MRGRVSAKIVNCNDDPRVISRKLIRVERDEFIKSYDDVNFCLSSLSAASWGFIARIGIKRVVFGLVTPLDHPPEATFLFYIYIIYSSDRCMRGVGVRWSSGGHETKTITCCPDPRDNN